MNVVAPHQRIAKELVQRGLGTPAVFFIEAFKPFSLVAQQTLYATTPLAAMSGLSPWHKDLTSIFESRENLEDLMLEMERLMEAEPR